MTMVLRAVQDPGPLPLDQWPAIIAEAAKSVYGLFALMLLLLAVVALILFRRSDNKTKLMVFALLFVGVAIFGYNIMGRVPEGVEAIASDSTRSDLMAAFDTIPRDSLFKFSVLAATNARDSIRSRSIPVSIRISGGSRRATAVIADRVLPLKRIGSDWVATSQLEVSTARVPILLRFIGAPSTRWSAEVDIGGVHKHYYGTLGAQGSDIFSVSLPIRNAR